MENFEKLEKTVVFVGNTLYGDGEPPLSKLLKEIKELEEAIKVKNYHSINDEIGDCLFLLVRLAAQNNSNVTALLEHILLKSIKRLHNPNYLRPVNTSSNGMSNNVAGDEYLLQPDKVTNLVTREHTAPEGLYYREDTLIEIAMDYNELVTGKQTSQAKKDVFIKFLHNGNYEHVINLSLSDFDEGPILPQNMPNTSPETKKPVKKRFEDQLSDLINTHGIENGSNTPDFILAEYLVSCLAVFNNHVISREKWYGRETVTGGITHVEAYHKR